MRLLVPKSVMPWKVLRDNAARVCRPSVERLDTGTVWARLSDLRFSEDAAPPRWPAWQILFTDILSIFSFILDADISLSRIRTKCAITVRQQRSLRNPWQDKLQSTITSDQSAIYCEKL